MTLNVPYRSPSPMYDLSIQPPYEMTRVHLRCFPIPADPIRLRAFVEDYLNVVPREVAHFEPVIPFVVLVASHTDEAGQGSASGGSQYGFLAQTNVMFLIPLLWYRQEGGRMVLHDYAITIPFSYTSDWHSLFIMRSIFGWPNVSGWAGAEVLPWVHDVDPWGSVFTLKSLQMNLAWRGEEKTPGRLLQIERSVHPGRYQLPWRPGGDRDPFSLAPRFLNGLSSTMGGLFSTLRWWLELARMWPVGTSARKQAGLSLGRFQSSENVIGLKQFRDAERQDRVCYQALIRARGTATRIHRLGLLGNHPLPFVDPTGGYRIRYSKSFTDPLLSLLGLQVARWESDLAPVDASLTQETTGVVDNTSLKELPEPSAHRSRTPQRSVAILEPYFPFWLQCNMTYSEGEVLAWRLRDTAWMSPFEETRCTATDAEKALHRSRGFCAYGETWPGGNLYNTSTGLSVLEYSGPYLLRGTGRILVLHADEKKLQKVIDRNLKVEEDYRNIFEAWGNHVFLLVANFEDTVSVTENVANWRHRQLTFLVPVKWFHKKDDRDWYWSATFCAPFSFTDNESMMVTMAQIFGISNVLSDLESPDSVWIDADGPVVDQPLMRVWTLLNPAKRFPVFNERTVLAEIFSRPKGSSRETSKDEERVNNIGAFKDLGVLEDLGAFKNFLYQNEEKFTDDSSGIISKLKECLIGYEGLEDLDGKGNLLESEFRYLMGKLENCASEMGFEIPSNILGLKQIFGAEATTNSVYQALVLTRTTDTRFERLGKIDEEMELRIHHTPMLPIVEDLGLTTDSTKTGKSRRPHRVWQGGLTDYIRPVESFWYRFTWTFGEATNVWWRAAGSPKLTHGRQCEDYMRKCDAPGGYMRKDDAPDGSPGKISTPPVLRRGDAPKAGKLDQLKPIEILNIITKVLGWNDGA